MARDAGWSGKRALYVAVPVVLLALIAALAAGVGAASDPRAVVPGCWSVDYDEMMRTNHIPEPWKPERFDALVKGYSYRFSPDELSVSFSGGLLGDPADGE